jgi:hypothetical protein
MRNKPVVAAVAATLSVVAFSASSAYATPPFNLRAGLELSERGTRVAAGGPLVSEDFIVNGECIEASYAKLLNNDDPVDVIQVEPPVDDECKQGTLSGAIKYVALSDTGQALVVALPSLALTTAAGCVYDLTLLAGEFDVGPEAAAYVTGEATGLRSPASSKTCARTIRTGFNVGEYGQDSFLLTPSLVEGPKF